jgi:hypothetical protein
MPIPSRPDLVDAARNLVAAACDPSHPLHGTFDWDEETMCLFSFLTDDGREPSKVRMDPQLAGLLVHDALRRIRFNVRTARLSALQFMREAGMRIDRINGMHRMYGEFIVHEDGGGFTADECARRYGEDEA